MGAVRWMQCFGGRLTNNLPGEFACRINFIPLGGIRIYSFGRRNIMQDTLRLSIEGMHCGGCVRRVAAALEGVKGVQLGPVEVGSARMTFHPDQASAEEIAAAVNRIGFSTRI